MYSSNYLTLTNTVFIHVLLITTICHHVGAIALDNQPRRRVVISPEEPVFSIDTQSPTRVLTCRPSGDKPQLFGQLRWAGPNRYDNWEELRKKHNVFESVQNSNTWHLLFKNPTVDDAGVYYCLSNYMMSESLNASITVKVTNPIKLDNCPERQFIVRGMISNKVTCRITADLPSVTLLKDDKPIEQYNGRYKWDNDDGIVINGDVESSDAGRYVIQIIAQTTGEFKQQYIDVEVHSLPEIAPYDGTLNENESEFYGVEGEPAQLKCQVSGNPRPIIYWLDPKRRNVTSVGGYIVNPEMGVLTINKVTKFDDDGLFECFAYNTVGTTSRKVSMTVDTRPQITSFENKTVDEGSDVIFECRSSGDPPPNFSIRKDGLNQTSYKIGNGFVKDVDTQPEGGGSNIYIHRMKLTASRALFGVHYCNATNRAGTAERLNHLAVNYRPDLSATPIEQPIRRGKKVVITCHIRAFPEPTITWLIDGVQISNIVSNTKTDGQTHVVTMMPPEQTAFSKFTCRAHNKMGDSEQVITARYTTAPGIVSATLIERSPTSIKLLLSVPNDGGDRIRSFIYRAEGRTLDIHNPFYQYRDDIQNDTILEAMPGASAVYTITKLLPYYHYRITIRAVNDVGEGDWTDIPVETPKPTRPESPIIIKPSTALPQHSTPGFVSEYQNGYLLRWSPPDSDNGDYITKYIITYNKIENDALDIASSIGAQTIIEQMSERPLQARLGPLDVGHRYKIQIQARNRIGDSDPAQIIIQTMPDRPPMPEFEAQTLSWLIEPSTPTLIGLLALAIFLLIIIDLIFCFCYQIGLTHMMRTWCCPAKTNSVISDKNYT